MPGPIYQDNTTYGGDANYQAVSAAMQNIGRQAAAARKSSPKSFPVQNYQGVASNVSPAYANSTPSTISPKLSSLGTVTTPYGGNTKYEAFHPGIDIANKIGTAIPAFSGGTVVSEVSGKKQGDADFGNTIIVKDALGRQWRYSHLSNEYVKVGQTVTPGMQIGAMGNSGQTYSTSGGTGSHLDLRIKDAYGKYVNPSSLI